MIDTPNQDDADPDPRRRRGSGSSLLAFGLASCLLASCYGPVQYLEPFNGPREVGCSSGSTAAVELTYLGAGGFLIRHRDHALHINRAIMTGPFFSNPGLFRSLLGRPIAPDAARIAQFLPPVGDVTAILIGHAHYDHLMDTIHVAENFAPEAILYGNDTMVHIANARPALRSRIRSLESVAGDSRTPGQWQPLAGGGMRVMALRSEHAPQFLGVKAFEGDIDQDLTELPGNAYGWKGGRTLAFLIDVLDASGSPLLRFHYQDAASTPPLGFPPPPDTIGSRPVDVALLCVASFDQVAQYPEALMTALQPRHVVLAHWENFFSRRRPPPPLPFLDTLSFATRLTGALPPGAKWHTPVPATSTIRFCLP
jgi:hypothetical protein